MKDIVNKAQHEMSAEERLNSIYCAQKKAVNQNPYPNIADRKRQLKALRRQVQRYQDLIAEALYEDFGGRAAAESKLLDALGPAMMISHALRNLRRWMKPSRRSTEILFATNSIKVNYQPKGVVGVIAPWNLPLYTAIGPLCMALAAGNRVMLKLSELLPQTNKVRFLHGLP